VSYSVINRYSFPNLPVETHTVMLWIFLYKYRTSKYPKFY